MPAANRATTTQYELCTEFMFAIDNMTNGKIAPPLTLLIMMLATHLVQRPIPRILMAKMRGMSGRVNQLSGSVFCGEMNHASLSRIRSLPVRNAHEDRRAVTGLREDAHRAAKRFDALDDG